MFSKTDQWVSLLLTYLDAYSQDQVPVTVVCFIGGCTYTEIAALRFTSQRMTGRKLIIITTGIINGGTIMDSIGPPRAQSQKGK